MHVWCKISVLQHDVRCYPTRNWREDHLNYNDVKKWEYRDLYRNLGIFWELTWDFYKIIVGNAALGSQTSLLKTYRNRNIKCILDLVVENETSDYVFAFAKLPNQVCTCTWRETTNWTKALGKLGDIVAETFVILDVSSNVSMFAHPWKHRCGNKICSYQIQKHLMFPYVSH
jgi:hypothetical protein